MADSRPRSFGMFLVIGTLIIGAAGFYGWHYFKSRETVQAEQARAKAAQLAAGPSVGVAVSQRGPNVRKLNLVGEVVPWRTTTIFSKVSGYLSRITVDVGDAVKAGQVLAEIQAPEIDAQIATIAAGLDNKNRLAQRARELTRAGFFSAQALDNAENEVRVARSQIAELRTLGGYRVVKAPFTGTVTNRFADEGAMVTNAVSSQSAALPLVTLADTTHLKVTVFAEQADAPSIGAGLVAEVIDASAPERKVMGKVVRLAGELDTRTRTRRIEVEFDNAQGTFVSGSFVNVSVMIPATSYIEVPAGALVTRDKKTWVAVVDENRTARFLPVIVAGTDGKILRIASGLDAGATVAVSPPASLTDGSRVDPHPIPGAQPAPAKPASGTR